MPAISATAPGKIILFGEHTVVYGRPAIAFPVNQVSARVIVLAKPIGEKGEIQIQAPDIALEEKFSLLPIEDPIKQTIELILESLNINRSPSCIIRISSTIPSSSGMGSGTAVSVALIRAFSKFMGATLSSEEVSEIAFEVEKIHHGTPSGIDNSVITFGIPIYYVRDQPIEKIKLAYPLTFVIGDTGIKSPTSKAVNGVRVAWKANSRFYESMFDMAADITIEARRLIETNGLVELGKLMFENQAILQEIGVSSLELENLITAARSAGALGAKLSGAGCGGNMIALVRKGEAQTVAQGLLDAGAVNTIINEFM